MCEGGFAHAPRWQEVRQLRQGSLIPYGRRMAPHLASVAEADEA
jgi:hypothetical protein